MYCYNRAVAQFPIKNRGELHFGIPYKSTTDFKLWCSPPDTRLKATGPLVRSSNHTLRLWSWGRQHSVPIFWKGKTDIYSSTSNCQQRDAMSYHQLVIRLKAACEIPDTSLGDTDAIKSFWLDVEWGLSDLPFNKNWKFRLSPWSVVTRILLRNIGAPRICAHISIGTVYILFALDVVMLFLRYDWLLPCHIYWSGLSQIWNCDSIVIKTLLKNS